MAALPPLVITGNRIDVLGAIGLYGTTMHSFCVPADPVKLQALLDKTFATPSGGAVRYEAVGDKVFLSFAEIRKCVALDRFEANNGSSSEIDVTIWIMAHRQGGGLLELRWIPMYLYVNSAPAMASGREVWGFPKQFGRFNFTPAQPDPGAARTFLVDGFVLSPYAPSSIARWAPMLAVRPLAPAPKPSGVLASLEALAEHAMTRLGEGFADIAGRLQHALGTGTATLAFLKQFPDAANPMTACYQGIIEAETRVLTLRGAGVTNDHYTVEMTSFANQPFLDELGVVGGPQDVGQGVWIDFDFTLALGQEVWRAPVG